MFASVTEKKNMYTKNEVLAAAKLLKEHCGRYCAAECMFWSKENEGCLLRPQSGMPLPEKKPESWDLDKVSMEQEAVFTFDMAVRTDDNGQWHKERIRDVDDAMDFKKKMNLKIEKEGIPITLF